MLFAALEFTDFAIIAAIVAVLVGGSAAARYYFRPADRERLARVEQKVSSAADPRRAGLHPGPEGSLAGACRRGDRP